MVREKGWWTMAKVKKQAVQERKRGRVELAQGLGLEVDSQNVAWLWFQSSDQQVCLVNLTAYAQERKGTVIGQAILGWIEDTKKRMGL